MNIYVIFTSNNFNQLWEASLHNVGYKQGKHLSTLWVTIITIIHKQCMLQPKDTLDTSRYITYIKYFFVRLYDQ